MITARVKGRGEMRRRGIEEEEGKRDRIVEKKRIRGKSSFRPTTVVVRPKVSSDPVCISGTAIRQHCDGAERAVV